MSRFKPGDEIRQIRYNETIKIGTVLKGPYAIDKVDHYTVKWTWNEDGFGKLWNGDEIIADLPSAKYQYI